MKEKSNNTLTFNGITRKFNEWDDIYKFPRGTVKRRKLINKWTTEKCLKAPIGNHSSAGRFGASRSPWRYDGGSNFKVHVNA